MEEAAGGGRHEAVVAVAAMVRDVQRNRTEDQNR